MSVTVNGSSGLTFGDGSTQNTSPFTGGLGFRNRIINGDFRIDQRNAGASVTPNSTAYTIDRWQLSTGVSSKLSIQQSSTAPVGFTNSVLLTSTSAYTPSASDYISFCHKVEGFNFADMMWGTANAQTVTLSFWVRSSLTGTFSGALQSDGAGRSYPFTYTISAANTFEYKTITIAGDTSGTWNTTNGKGVELHFNMGSGSNLLGTAGAWASAWKTGATGSVSLVGTNGATMYLTGVQLEKGSTATSFDYRPYGTELALCQRYFEMSFSQGEAPANGTSNTFKFISSAINSSTGYANGGVFCTEKRSAPTMTFYRTDNGSSNGQPAYFNGAWNNGTSISPASRTRSFQFNFGGSFTSNNAYLTDVQWTASAEL